MALTSAQIDEVLGYSAFQSYNAPQKASLREKLRSSGLEYIQIELLFSDDVSGGLIHNLVEDSLSNDAAARQLGKIVANIKESMSPEYGYPDTPIIQNMIGRLGSIPFSELADDTKETIFDDVKWLVNQHISIYNARVIAPPIDNPLDDDNPLAQQNDLSPMALFASDDSGVTVLLLLLARAPNLGNLQLEDMPDPAAQHRFFSRRNAALQAHALARELAASPAVQLELLDNRIRANPDDLEARLERAQLSFSSDIAMTHYNYILVKEPNNVAALLGRAQNSEMEHSEAALEDYRHVLEIESENPLALNGVERLEPRVTRPE
ncbi:MAG: hypothetical protein Q8M03_12850 [Legionella sp.]|nr:hypothetical protein [Legionella sp.]